MCAGDWHDGAPLSARRDGLRAVVVAFPVAVAFAVFVAVAAAANPNPEAVRARLRA